MRGKINITRNTNSISNITIIMTKQIKIKQNEQEMNITNKNKMHKLEANFIQRGNIKIQENKHNEYRIINKIFLLFN